MVGAVALRAREAVRVTVVLAVAAAAPAAVVLAARVAVAQEEPEPVEVRESLVVVAGLVPEERAGSAPVAVQLGPAAVGAQAVAFRRMTVSRVATGSTTTATA